MVNLLLIKIKIKTRFMCSIVMIDPSEKSFPMSLAPLYVYLSYICSCCASVLKFLLISVSLVCIKKVTRKIRGLGYSYHAREQTNFHVRHSHKPGASHLLSSNKHGGA